MDTFILYCSIFVAFVTFLSTYRAVVGPTDVDRIISVGAIGTKTIVLILLMGIIYKRLDMFIDIALCYAIINFIGTLIFAKYFMRKGVTE